MGKLFFLIIIAGLIYWVIKNRQPKKEKTEELESYEDTVSCSHCGVHLPKSEAINSHENKYFCCAEHRNLYTNSLS